ncbi:MAG: hypothetical protein AAB356_07680, partial [Deltaproteobacteria bacterium]
MMVPLSPGQPLTPLAQIILSVTTEKIMQKTNLPGGAEPQSVPVVSAEQRALSAVLPTLAVVNVKDSTFSYAI